MSELHPTANLGTIRRRAFLKDLGLGCGSVALSTMLHRDATASEQLHFAPKAKHVIWLFMIGGTSHLESFDPEARIEPLCGDDDQPRLRIVTC